MRRRAFLAVLIASPLVLVAAPSSTPELRNPRTQEPRNLGTMNALADRYVKLVLAVGQQDDGYVDAYYGPAQWKADADALNQDQPANDADNTAHLSRLLELR